MKNTILLIQILCLSMLAFQCSDPDVVLTTEKQSSTISGIVHPVNCKAFINLIKGSDTIAQTETNGINGIFTFNDIPHGNYIISANTNSLYRQTDVQVSREPYKVTITMQTGNQFVTLVNCDSNNLLLSEWV